VQARHCPAGPAPAGLPHTLSSTASVSRLKRAAIALMRSGLNVPSAGQQDMAHSSLVSLCCCSLRSGTAACWASICCQLPPQIMTGLQAVPTASCPASANLAVHISEPVSMYAALPAPPPWLSGSCTATQSVWHNCVLPVLQEEAAGRASVNTPWPVSVGRLRLKRAHRLVASA
jgi:hypothetical protein